MISNEQMIAAIESSTSVREAAEKLGWSRQNVHTRLKKHNLKIVKQLPKLKVIRSK